MKPFRREAQGFVAFMEPGERAVLAQLAGDVAAMLRGEVPVGETAEGWSPPGWIGPPSPATVPVPDDPAVRRLLPAASQDEAVAAEFRRLTAPGLAGEKVARLKLFARLLVGAGATDRLVVVPDDAERVAGALTDVRLVLAERLHLRTDEQVEVLYDELLEGPDTDEDAAPDGDDAPDGNDGNDGKKNIDGNDAPGGEPPGDAAARRFLVGVFLLAGLLQESLVDGMLGELRRRPRH